MKSFYVSTFTSGLSSVIKKLLRECIYDVEIIKLYDGLVIYKTSEHKKIYKLSFFNNSFLLLSKIKTDLKKEFNKELEKIIFEKDIDFNNINQHMSYLKKQNFKIKAIDRNKPYSINYTIVNPIEKLISNALNININKRNPELEFVFLRRSEGWIFFMLKLTYNRITEKSLKKGELRPELAYILISLANLNKDKILLDPFCGSGAIPKQAIKNFSYNMCFASDINEDLVNKLKKEYKKNNKKLFIKNKDALNLSYINDKFIDVIVTDPPWNCFNKKLETFDKFYQKMLKEFERVLKDNGCLIILMGNIEEFEKAVTFIKTLKKEKVYNILVNGKKANIYVFYKI